MKFITCRATATAKKVRGGWLFVLLLLAVIPPMGAQVAGGTISGTITDSTGAVISSAKVKITHRTTGVSRVLTTSSTGSYSAPNLSSGQYDVEVSASGFEEVKAENIKVDVGSSELIDLKLPVGESSAVVDVTATLPTIDLGSATLSVAVNGNEVRELPLNGRDWTSLAGLQPGVVTLTTQSAPSVSNQRANSGYGQQFSIGGVRPDQNNYRLDGISINDYSNGSPADVIGLVLGVDAIAEFTVSTNTTDASYGRGAGGVIDSTTRQGSNQLHGSAFEFARNSVFDAKNYFDSATAPIPSFSRNQFGGTLGGPIVRNHSYGFGAYEGLRQSLGLTNGNLLVPSRAAIAAAAPAVKPFFALYPLADPASEAGFVGITSTIVQQVAHEDFVTGRFDQTFSQKDGLFGTFVWDDNDITQPDVFKNQTLGNVAGRLTAIVEETHTFTQALVNSLRVGFNRTRSDAPTTISVTNPAAKDPTLGFVPGRNVGSLAITGWTTMPGGLGAIGEYNFVGNSYQVYDDGYYMRGNHSFKFGGAVERIQKNQQGQASPSGAYTYSSITSFLANGSAASFSSGIGGTNSPRDLRSTVVGVYFGDNWRLLKNLTLDLGLRYEMATVPIESKGKLTNLPTLQSSTPHLGSPYFKNPTRLDFQPRIGVIWDPFSDGKTSVRAGFGMYDNLPLPQMYLLLSVLSAPFYQQGSISNTPAGSFPTGVYPLLTPNKLRYAYLDPVPPRSYNMQYNLNVQRDLGKKLTLTLAYAGTRGFNLPYQDSDFNMVLPSQVNGVYYWPSPKGSGTRQNPNVGQIQGLLWNSTAHYNGLQALLSHSLSHGVQLGAAYTFSKALDTESSSNASGSFNNSVRRLYFCPSCGYGLADFDTRHVFNLNAIWQIPSAQNANDAVKTLVNGWELSTITTIATGQPLTPTISGDAVGMNVVSSAFDYPDRVYGPGCGSAISPHSIKYVNVNCFVFPAQPLRLGNVQRNSIIGPGLLMVGTSFSRNLAVKRISDTFRVQFRADIFNIINHANFQMPTASSLQLFTATGTRVANAGLISSTATSSRQIQLSAKVVW